MHARTHRGSCAASVYHAPARSSLACLGAKARSSGPVALSSSAGRAVSVQRLRPSSGTAVVRRCDLTASFSCSSRRSRHTPRFSTSRRRSLWSGCPRHVHAAARGAVAVPARAPARLCRRACGCDCVLTPPRERPHSLTHAHARMRTRPHARAHGCIRVVCFRARASNTNEALGRERRQKFEAFLQVVRPLVRTH